MKRAERKHISAYYRKKEDIKSKNNLNPNAYQVYYVSPSITRRKPSSPPKQEILTNLQGEYTRLNLL